jgi:hypothetical protein
MQARTALNDPTRMHVDGLHCTHMTYSLQLYPFTTRSNCPTRERSLPANHANAAANVCTHAAACSTNMHLYTQPKNYAAVVACIHMKPLPLSCCCQPCCLCAVHTAVPASGSHCACATPGRSIDRTDVPEIAAVPLRPLMQLTSRYASTAASAPTHAAPLHPQLQRQHIQPPVPVAAHLISLCSV